MFSRLLPRPLGLFLCLCLSLILGGAMRQEKQGKVYHLNFELATSNTVGNTLDVVAEALCLQDKTTDASASAWEKAGHLCADSWRDEENGSSRDGGWQAYTELAVQILRQMCAERLSTDGICQYYK